MNARFSVGDFLLMTGQASEEPEQMIVKVNEIERCYETKFCFISIRDGVRKVVISAAPRRLDFEKQHLYEVTG